MDISELKDKIKSRSLDDSALIFKYSDNGWLADSYIKAIADLKHREIFYLDDLSSIKSIVDTNGYLYVLKTDEFNEEINYKNLIIVTKKSNLNNVIEFPKLELWQIQEYMKVKLPGLDKEDIDYIFNLTKNNIYLMDREVNKIASSLKSNQKIIFELLKKENNYKYLSISNSFELVNLIIKKDLANLSSYLENIDDIEPMGLVSLLLNQYKNIIKVKMGSKDNNPEKLGFEPKRWNAIQYIANKYTEKELVSKFEFITSIDYKLKEGELDISKKDLFYYILTQLIV